MKNINKIVLVFLFALLLVSCDDGRKSFEDDYQMFKDIEHVFVKVDYKTVYESLTKEKGSSVILFAYNPHLSTCPFCLEVLPIINEVAMESGIEEIQYFDIWAIRKDRTDEYENLLNYILEQVDDLDKREDKFEIIVPDLYVLKDGEILGHHIATLKDEEGKYIRNLSVDEVLELKEIYKNLFNEMKS